MLYLNLKLYKSRQILIYYSEIKELIVSMGVLGLKNEHFCPRNISPGQNCQKIKISHLVPRQNYAKNIRLFILPDTKRNFLI